ncbi:hypothetical protein V2J74_27100 [Pseudomonas alliivorans]|nr:hypothetical protein [Pseudomonas alliivorans]
MSIEKVREEYEAWVLREYPNQHMGRFATGEYHSTVIEHCWQAWQASREAQVIELPDQYKYADPGEAVHVIIDCRSAIEAAGVKVKS